MRNLWVFLYRNRTIFWFFAFQILAFVLIFRFNAYQGGLYFNSTNRIVAGIFLQKSKIESYLRLQTTNETLAKENAQLRNQLPTSKLEILDHEKLIQDSINHQQYLFLEAKVVNNSTIHRDNYLTLNKGSLDSVKTGMGVIFSNGVLGVVKDVSEHYCVVLSILHSASRVSVKIRKSKNIGSLFWDGLNSQVLSIRDVPNYVDLKKGDTVETSGFSFFPKGIAIGTVIGPGISNGEGSLIIQMKLLADLNKLDEVYIVKDKFSTEKNLLETNSQK